MVSEYFAALFHSWVGKMSGPASVVLVFLPILLPRLFEDNAELIKATWILAAVCFGIANYSAWKYERDRYQSEVAKNQKPEIRGEARNFKKVGSHGDSYDHGLKQVNFGVQFSLFMSNHRPPPTNLVNVSIVGKLLSRRMLYSDLEFESVRLDRGIAVKVIVRATFFIWGLAMGDIQDVEASLKELRIYAVDGFGDFHPIEIPDDEILFL